MPNDSAQILVIGVGNSYRGDDGVGPFIAQRLRENKLPETVAISEGRAGASLMDTWLGASLVIIIDAMNSGDLPGKIRHFDARREPLPKMFFPSTTHHFGVAEAVELARVLDRLPPSIIIYGIEGKSFEQGIGLSPEVLKAAKEIEGRVLRDIHDEVRTPIVPAGSG